MTVVLAIILVVVLVALQTTPTQPMEHTSTITPAPILGREDYLLSILPDSTIDAILLGTRNIQEHSFHWLLEDPNSRGLLFSHCS
jgi:hypothetical protein